MNFSTPVQIPPAPFQIEYNDKLLSLGSCFSDEIAAYLQQYYFQITSNPFGTLYNPISIAHALTMTELDEPVCYHGLWHLMSHHGSFSSATQDEVLRSGQLSLLSLQKARQEASFLLITFGTSWVYEMDGRVVANCHKMPETCFERRQLNVDEIVQIWQSIIDKMPNKHFIFTVSPIRHIKDGLHANHLSKAILLQAVDHLVASYPERCAYFPSYEILLDELRDYRYYADDLVHPSHLAVEYIGEQFTSTFMSANTQLEMKPLHQLYLDLHHTILHPDTESAKAFLAHTEQEKRMLQLSYPWIV